MEMKVERVRGVGQSGLVQTMSDRSFYIRILHNRTIAHIAFRVRAKFEDIWCPNANESVQGIPPSSSN